MVRSLFVWFATWLYMVCAGLCTVPFTLVTGKLEPMYAASRLGMRILLALAGVRVIVHGREHLPAAGGCLYLANHQSNLDPPILMLKVPGQIAFLAKRELFRLPVLGALLRIGGMVPIDRDDRAAAEAGIARAAAAVRDGRPFLVFPEGSRSRDGKVLPFKKGPFYLAEQAQRPVLPVTVVGTAALMPPGSVRIRSGTVHVFFHPPFDPQGLSREDISARARAAIAASLTAESRLP